MLWETNLMPAALAAEIACKDGYGGFRFFCEVKGA